ncbi:uncharacterized protein [Ambystoma mexicanum]|uniref:uncharacterized protein n=1 Tax=Ambystoma mexicanum TaxID=8296 RepID=UPI0037E7FB38
MAMLTILARLEAKIDHLQNNMEDMPIKVTGLMEQIWLTKIQDFLKSGVTSVESRPNQGIQTVPTARQNDEQMQCRRKVFPDGRGPRQSLKLEPVDHEEPVQVQNLNTHIFLDGESPRRNCNLDPLCSLGQGLDQTYKLEPLGPYDEAPPDHPPPLGSHVPADGDAFIDSLMRRNGKPEIRRYKAVSGSMCGRPASTDRIKEEASGEDVQDCEEREWMNEDAELSVADHRGLAIKPSSASDPKGFAEEVAISEWGETLVRNSPRLRKKFSFRARQCSEKRKDNEKPGESASMEEEPAVRPHKCVRDRTSLGADHGLKSAACIRPCNGLGKEHSPQPYLEEDLCRGPYRDLEESSLSTQYSKEEVLCAGPHKRLEEELSQKSHQSSMEEPPIGALYCLETRTRNKSPGARATFEEEPVPFKILQMILREGHIISPNESLEKPCTKPHREATPQSHRTLSENASFSYPQGSVEHGKIGEGKELSYTSAHDPRGRDRLKQDAATAKEHQEEVREESKETQPAAEDAHKSKKGRDQAEEDLGDLWDSVLEHSEEESYFAGNRTINTKILQIHPGQCNIQRHSRHPPEDNGQSGELRKNSIDSRESQVLYICADCGQSFSDSLSFQRHQSCHESHHQCTYCEQSFIQRSQLMVHLRTHRREEAFACSVSGKGFANRSRLATHKSSHMSEKYYKCMQCEKTFTRRSLLCKHQRIHTGEKPYKCMQCGKDFTVAASLRRHQSIHTGARPYWCLVCEKGFTRNSGLCMHQRIHSGEKPYRCPECSKQFTQKSHLRQHLRIHSREKP